MLSVMMLAAGLNAALEVDTELKPNNLELDAGSYLYHWDRSEEWNEGFSNNYIGFQYSVDQANVYMKGSIFKNSYGDDGGVLGGGIYTDDVGRYKQGLEAGITWGYKRDEGSSVFLGYAGRLDVTNTIKLKVHINPTFAGVIMSFDL